MGSHSSRVFTEKRPELAAAFPMRLDPHDQQCASCIKALMMTGLPEGGAPGTTKAWVTQRPAQTPRQLVIQAGSWSTTAAADAWSSAPAGSVCGPARLPAGTLRRRLQRPRLAEELGESEWTISRALATQRITLPSP